MGTSFIGCGVKPGASPAEAARRRHGRYNTALHNHVNQIDAMHNPDRENPQRSGKGSLTFSKLQPLTLFRYSLRSGAKLEKLRKCSLLANRDPPWTGLETATRRPLKRDSLQADEHNLASRISD